MNELYHHGVKGMKWGVRKAQFKRTVNRTMGAFLGIENKYLNRALSSTGKLRKAYLDAQTLGVKTNKRGQYKYSHKDPDLYKRQQQAARRAQRFAKEFLEKYNKKPMSYLQSINAQKGAAIGTAAGIAVPVILPLWATIPAGYYIGSKVGGQSMKHSEELCHYGVKGMRWKHHRYRDNSSGNGSGNPITTWFKDTGEKAANYVDENAAQMQNNTERVASRVQNDINTGQYERAFNEGLHAYQNDSHVRAAVDGTVTHVLSDLSDSDDWRQQVLGRLGTMGWNVFNNTIGRDRSDHVALPRRERLKARRAHHTIEEITRGRRKIRGHGGGGARG